MRGLSVLAALVAPVLAWGADCSAVPGGELRLDEAAHPEFQEVRATVEAWIRSCGPVNVQVRARSTGDQVSDDAASAEDAVDAFFDEILALAALEQEQLNRRPFHLEPAVIVNGVDETLLAALLAAASVERVTVMEASDTP